MLVAGSGQLSAGAGGAVRTLTLKNVEPDVLWYAGGQSVEVGKSAAKEYAGNIWRDAYDGIDPNATVQFQLSGEVGWKACMWCFPDLPTMKRPGP